MNSKLSLRALFDHALDMPPAERGRWLEQLRGNDPALARRLERLLARDATGPDLVSRAVASLRRSVAFDATAWLGRELGGFRLLELLGEGGMGAVFLAERKVQDFEQRVALKVARGSLADDAMAARIAGECRILARLNHPNIATLIDAGTDAEGRPWMAMQYVDGMPLLAWCDGHRLGVAQRLRLAHGLLSALAYAHRSLVVHRDLKPGNVLVTADGIPKLLDFGIARLLSGDVVGGGTTLHPFTPNYASPEQMAGEVVGTSSDIFSVGLVLYELCAGVLPWAAGTRSRSLGDSLLVGTRFRQLPDERQQQLAERRGCDVRRLAKHLRGDLGRVLARCLAPDPADRYGTVESLKRDLEAVLDRRPPPGVHVAAPRRALAFMRRHAWPVAVGGLIVLSVATLLVQSLVNERRLAAQRDRALAAAHEAQTESAKARQVADFVQTMLGGIDPDLAKGKDRSLMRLVLDSAGERAATQLAGQPAVRMAVERTIAISYNSIGEYDQAMHHIDAAITAAQNGQADLDERVRLRVSKARILGNAGHRKQALAVLEKAVSDAARLPADDPVRLRAEATRAGAFCDDGRFAVCRDRYADVVPRMQRVLGKDAGNTLEAMRSLAYAESKLAHYDRARGLYEELIPRLDARYGKANSRSLSAVNGLAITYLQQEQFARAEALLEPAVQRAIGSFGRDHPLTINMLSNLGGAIRQQPGRNAEARPYYQEVLRASIALYGDNSLRAALARMNFALLLRDAGELGEADRLARAALATADAVTSANSVYRAIFREKLATILLREQKYAEADKVLGRAWAIINQAPGFGRNHPAVQAVIRDYVALYTARGEPGQAAHWQAMLADTPEQTVSEK